MKLEEPGESSEERTEVLVEQAGCGALGLGHRYTRGLLYQIK